MEKRLVFTICALAAFTFRANATQVTATVVSAENSPFSFGTYRATLVDANRNPLYIAPGNNNYSGPYIVTGSLDANGYFAVSLTANSLIASGSQWALTICSSATSTAIFGTSQCFTVYANIAGSAQDWSTTLSSAAPSLAISSPALTLPADPVNNLQAATKHYVDTHGGGTGGGGTVNTGAIGQFGFYAANGSVISGRTLSSGDVSGALGYAPVSPANYPTLSDLAPLGIGISRTDGAMALGSCALNSASGSFSPGSVGAYTEVVGADVGGATLETTITAYVSASQVTLAKCASTTVTGARYLYGTNNWANGYAQAVLDSVGMSGGGSVHVPSPPACPAGADCGYIFAATDGSCGLKLRFNNLSLEGDAQGTNLFFRGAWTNSSGNVLRGHGICIGDSAGGSYLPNAKTIALKNLKLYGMSTGETANVIALASVALNGDGWDPTHHAIHYLPNYGHSGALIDHVVAQDWKGEEVYSGGVGFTDLVVQNSFFSNSEASLLSVSVNDLLVTNSEFSSAGNCVENGTFGQYMIRQSFINLKCSNMAGSGITLVGEDAYTNAGAVQISHVAFDTIGVGPWATQTKSAIAIGVGISGGMAPTALDISDNTARDTYDFFNGASGYLNGAKFSNNRQIVDKYAAQAFLIAPATMTDTLFENNSVSYTPYAAANGNALNYVYFLTGGAAAGALNWNNTQFKNNTWKAAGAVYFNFATSTGSGWSAFAAGTKAPSFINDSCIGCAASSSVDNGQIAISNGGTITPYGPVITLTGGTGSPVMTIDASKSIDRHQVTIKNVGVAVGFASDGNLSLPSAFTLQPNSASTFQFFAADGKFHLITNDVAGSGGGGGSGSGLPSQTGNAGYLITNGASGNASWGDLTTGPSGALCAGTGCSGGTPGIIDIVTSVVPRLASANNFTGVNKFQQLQVSVYTVATLPTCNSSFEGQNEGVSDAVSPSYLATVTGGGSVHVPVYCNGTAWVAH